MSTESTRNRGNGAAAVVRKMFWPMRIVLVLGVAVTLTLLVTLFSAWQYSRSKHRLFEQELSTIRAQGLPVTAEELETYYYGTNAEARAHGSALVRVFDSYDDSLETVNEIFYSDRIPSPGEDYSDEDVEHAHSHLARNETYMDELHMLLSKNIDVRYPMNLADGWGVELPHLAQVRNALRMFMLQSFVASVDDDHRMLAQSLSDALAMSETLRNDPYVIAQLVRIACVGISWMQAQYALNALNLDVDSLSHLQRNVESLNLRGAIVVGLIGKRCMDYEGAVSIIGSTPAISSLDTTEYGFEEPAKFIWAEISAINLYLSLSELIELGERDPWERRRLADNYIKAATGGWSLLHHFEMIWMPAPGRAFSAEERALAHLATYRTALAILRFCSVQNRLPAGLAELLPAYLSKVPVDPSDGQPIRYIETDSGFTVYCLGDDLDDDGGVPPEEGQSIVNDGDIVFQVFDVSPYLATSSFSN